MRLAEKLLEKGSKVIGTTTSLHRFDELRRIGVEPCRFDLHERQYSRLTQYLQHDDLTVYFMLPPSRVILADGESHAFQQFIERFNGDGLRRAVLVSSTGVYESDHAHIITAETPANGSGARAGRLLEIERRWLSNDERFRICRLAGIYGDGRLVGEGAVRAGRALPGDGNAWLNLIHVMDAATLLVAIGNEMAGARIELGADGSPVRRQEYYQFLASSIGSGATVTFDENERRRGGSRQCIPQSTIDRTGWKPKFANYRDGVRNVLSVRKLQDQ